ncbi:hypothetical protein CYY_007764 [Polysphondylium violaceum]|uniref:Histone H2A/H2B/H3 domain-containing protein n=1 Tax=Polysphondylium violaceum TaxID=133409 RepID=A0A8J4UXH0_9MYCE|nr:hypothetical protein CYY_007764 [Polysphondylium violaceum]
MYNRGKLGKRKFTRIGYHSKHPREVQFLKKLIKECQFLKKKKLPIRVTASHVLASMIRYVAKEIINTAIELTAIDCCTSKQKQQSTRKPIISDRTIQTAVTLVLSGELSKYAVLFGTKAVQEKKKQTISVSYVQAQIKASCAAVSFTKDACIYLVGVLEYIFLELLDITVVVANYRKIPVCSYIVPYGLNNHVIMN